MDAFVIPVGVLVKHEVNVLVFFIFVNVWPLKISNGRSGDFFTMLVLFLTKNMNFF